MELNSYKYEYSKLTKESFDIFIKDYENRITSTNNWVIYTNDIGIIKVDISVIKTIYKNLPRVYYESIHKGKYKLMVSIGSKQSNIKAYYCPRTNSFDMKKGSELLFTFNSFSNTTFDKIKKYL